MSPAQEKKISVADCQFASNPDEFLTRSARIRHGLFNRAQQLTSVVGRKAVPVVSADSLPQRNFIDQEILGKLLKRGWAICCKTLPFWLTPQ